MKLIAHIDLNAFFVQVEELFNSSLKNKYVAIGRDTSRSVVSTANYLARTKGVHSGMPIKMAKEICPELIIVSDNFKQYSIYSRKFFSYLEKKFKQIEQTSIDECYIDISDYTDKEHARDFLRDLQIELFKETELKCSIGCGENKFLAKMGSDYQKPLGLTMIFKENVKDILWNIPIENMYGIGKKTAPVLKGLGIITIKDLALCEDKRVAKVLGTNFLHLKSHARGEGSDVLHYENFDPKSVSSARTFANDTSDSEELSSMVIHLAKQVSDELKKYHKTSRCVVITFRTPDFVTTSKRKQFDTYSNDQSLLVSRALQVFETYYNDQPLRLIGVGVSDVIDIEDAADQLSIFDMIENNKDNVEINDIENLIESINKSPGVKVMKASEIKTLKKKKKEYGGRFHIKEEDE